MNKDINAIGIVKQMVADGQISQDVAEKYFPELAESEDERIRKNCIEYIKASCLDIDELNECIAWLEKKGEQKSLNDVAKEVTKDKDAAISFLKFCGIMNESGELADEYKIEQCKQKSTEWSEEDEKMLSDIIKDLVHPWNEYIPDRIEEEIKWLKNKLKSLRPKSTWKPSDEQIKAVKLARSFVVDDFYEHPALSEILIELEEQLKKLREE